VNELSDKSPSGPVLSVLGETFISLGGPIVTTQSPRYKNYGKITCNSRASSEKVGRSIISINH